MRIANCIVVATTLCLAVALPHAAALNIILEPLSATTHPQILDGTVSFDEEPPAFDPASAGLLSILQEIEDDYEDVFEDAATIRITYWWDADMTFCCGQSIPSMMFEDGGGNLTHAIVRINPTVAYYIDPTPSNDSEYTMAQRLYSFGPNAITPAQQIARFTGTVPAVFEAGYNGAVDAGGPADGGLRDLLTLAYQEMGHSIGMNAGFTGVTNGGGTGEVDDGDYDVDPNLVNGNVMAMLPRGGTQDPLDHLVGNDAVMASLSTSTERTRPSTADYFAIAAAQGWTELDLPRKDFLGGGDWHDDSNWLGGLRALSLDEAYVRHGGGVTLSGIGNVRTLTVDNNSTLSTSIHTLIADFVTIQNTTGVGAPRIVVSDFGAMTSEIVNVENGARLDVFGGTAEIERLNIRSGGELRGNGTVDMSNVIGELTNDGTIRASGIGTLLITSDNNLGIDLDGDDEDGEVVATVADLDIQTGLTDPFNGTMTIGDGRFVNLGSGGSVGAGGLLLLDGTSTVAATVSGSVLFINPSGVVRADGIGVVDNPVFLGEGSISETADASSELRFNGTTYLNGGRIVGTGQARQNGDLYVGLDSEVEIATYDLDGQSGNTVVTVSPSSELVISSTFIDTGTGNDFDGTIHVNNGTLDIAASWQLDGTLNLNGQAMGGGAHDDHGGSEEENEGIAFLHGAGGVTVDNGGQINVTGSASVETAVQVNVGSVFVDGDAVFSGPNTFGVNADVEINHADDTLQLMGQTLLIGPSFVGSGRLLFDGEVNVAFFDTSIGVAETDLDGLLGDTQVLINSGLTFSIASITIEPTANDGFDGVITNHGTFSVLAGWRLDGDLEMEETGSSVPTLAGAGPFRIHTTGTFSTEGDAIVNPPTEVAGAMVIDGGVTQVNNTASFESTAVVIVEAGAELELNGATNFADGSYTGDGLIQFDATTNVDADTTIATGRVDLDGTAGNTNILLNNSALVLDVDGVDETNNDFSGTIDVAGIGGLLEVNLTNPTAVWRLTSLGTLNFSTAVFGGASTMLDGSDLVAEGTVNATGRVRLAANVLLSGRLQTTSSSTDVHFGSGGQNFIFNTADVAGTGSMTIENGTRMHLEDSTLVGIDVENAGRLEVGFNTTEVGFDLSAPGAATIRSAFQQSSAGTFAVNLGGYIQGDEFDLLTITETARIAGTLEVSLIDDFVPLVGDTFQVLTAASVVGTFDDLVAFDANDVMGLLVTALYSPTDVVVLIDDVFLLGDYNRNGTVDAADYAVWRNSIGTAVSPYAGADGDGDGIVTAADYGVWTSHFGATAPGSGSGMSAVPEPTAVYLVAGCFPLVLGCFRRAFGRR